MFLLEAEELTRARYRAAKDRILKMSIYDHKSGNEVQLMINQFMFLSGTEQVWHFLVVIIELDIEMKGRNIKMKDGYARKYL